MSENKKPMSMLGKMAVSSVLALSSVGGAVVAPQMAVVAHAATAVAPVSGNYTLSTANNKNNTFGIKVDSSYNDGQITMEYTFKLEAAVPSALYGVKLRLLGFNDTSNVKVTVDRGYVVSGGKLVSFDQTSGDYAELMSHITGGVSYGSKVTDGYTGLKKSKRDADAWKVTVTGPASAFNAHSRLVLDVSNSRDTNNIQFGANQDSTEEQGAIRDVNNGNAVQKINDPAYFTGVPDQFMAAVNAAVAADTKDGIADIQAKLDAAKALQTAAQAEAAKLKGTDKEAAANEYLKGINDQVSKLEGLVDQAKTASPSAIDGLKNQAAEALKTAQNAKDGLDELVAAQQADDAAAAKTLQEQKDAAKQHIDGLGLGDDAQGYKDRIDAATSGDAVKAIVAEAEKAAADKAQAAADAAAKAALQTLKDNAKAAIDSLPNLTNEQKTAYKAGVDTAGDRGAVLDVLGAAAKADVDSANATIADKVDAKNAIDAAVSAGKNSTSTGASVTDAIVKPAKDLDAKSNNDADSALQAAKNAGKKVIDGLTHLTQDQKDAYKAGVDAAATIDGVIDTVKDAVKADIDANSTMTDAEKEQAKKDVDSKANDAKSSQTPEAIDDMGTPAKNTGSNTGNTGNNGGNGSNTGNTGNNSGNTSGEDAVNTAKDEAKAAIDGMSNLTDQQKQDYKNRVDAAGTTSQIIVIVKEAAKQNIDQNPSLTDGEKQSAKEGVDASSDVATISGYANAEHQYTNGDVNNDDTTKPSTSGSAKIPFWVWILSALGLTGGVLGWGYVHDADFRAVVDGAIANVQHAIDDALGIRR